MSAAAITSALLPQGQGGAEPPAATQGALAMLDTVFGAILKGVDSEDAGSQVATRNFGASETNRDSSLPQPQGSAVKASASSPTATFEASLAALDYEAMAGTDGSSAIATAGETFPVSNADAGRRRSPRKWTPTASSSQTDSRKALTSRTATDRANALRKSTADANSSGASTRLASTRAAALTEIGQTGVSAASAAMGGTDGCKRRDIAFPQRRGPRERQGSLGRNSQRRKRNRHDRPQLSPTRRPLPRRSSTLLRRLRFRPRSPRPPRARHRFHKPQLHAPPTTETKAPVLELGQKFWTWPTLRRFGHRWSGEPLGSVRVDAAQ